MHSARGKNKFSTDNNTRVRLVIILLTVALGVAALSQVGGSATSTNPAQPAAIAQAPPTGTNFDHIVIIVMEDHGINQICTRSPPPCTNVNATFLAGFANSHAIGSQYLGVSHFSQADYIALLGGDIYGCVAFPCTRSNHVNLVDRLETAGLTWKGYMENQNDTRGGCDTVYNEPYTPEHNPFVFFNDILNNPTRCGHIARANPSTCTVTDCSLVNDLRSGTAPNFMWLTPNNCNNMHGVTNCTNGCTAPGFTCIKQGDIYLNSLVPNILSSTTFTTQRSALFVVFDEGEGYCPLNNSGEDCVYAVWAGPGVKTSFGSSNLYNHYSWTKTIETNWGFTPLSTPDATATAMTEFFTPDFTISATSPAVLASASVNSTITISPVSGFAGSVSLTDSVPSGLICGAITPNIISGGSGTAKVSCHASVAGNYTLAITGTSGSLTHSTTAIFRVQDFTIAATSPGPVNAGVSISSTITVTAVNGFTGIVSLTDTIPSGLTCGAIAPASVTGSGTATISCSATTSGNRTLTVTGTSSPLAHSALALFQFRDFTIAATSPPAVNVGVSATSTITIGSLNHFASVVNLTYTVPSGLTCGVITPNNVTGSGTATVSCSATAAGNYTLTIFGRSSLVVHNATAIFRFQDFTIAATLPSTVDVTVSTPATITVAALNHFTGVVSLSDTVPPGLTCGAISPTSVTGSGLATVSCTATVAGTYTLTINGTSGSIRHSTTAIFKFVDFTITASSPTAVNVGTSPTSTINITALNGFAGTTTLTRTVASGLTCGAINPSSVTGSGTATLTCTATVMGNYTLTITGTSAPLVHNATIIFRFQDFTIAASSPAPVDVTVAAPSTITISGLNHFSRIVTLTDTVPSGLTCGPITPNNVTGSGTASVSCSATIAGNYNLTVTGTNGSLTHSTVVTFRFQDFTIVASSPVAANAGSSMNSTITITALNGFSGVVNLTDAVPSGLTCAIITPISVTGSGSAMISCRASIAANYTITITGTSSPLVHAAGVTFRVLDFAIAATSPSAGNVGTSATSTLTISSLNGFAGTVTLKGTAPPSGLTCSLIVPGSVTGSGTATVSCNASVAGNYTLTLTGTSSLVVHNATATFSFQDFTVTASPPSSVNVGTPTTSTITVSPLNGFTGTVTLADTVPSGLTCGAITPNSVTKSGVATVSCYAAVFGNYTLTITGTNGILSHSATAAFIFQDFTIAASSPAPVRASISTTTTITITSLNGFKGNVSLTDIVANGLTCGIITPSTVSGGSGTATISCSATTAGNYNVTVTGTNGAVTHSATATFRVQDFTIIATSPAHVNIGTSANSTITITTLNGFAGNVTLTDIVPPGLVCGSITPSNVIGSGTAHVSCTATSAGNYNVTITGTSTPLTHAVISTFSFVDFTITASTPADFNTGATGSSTVTITSINGFSGKVTLTTTVAPSGLAPSCPASLNVTTTSIAGTCSPSSSSPGVYLVTITGTNGGLTHTTRFISHVGDFSVSATSPTGNAGFTINSTVTLTSSENFAGSVALTATVPAGLVCNAFTTTPVTLTSNGTGTSRLSCTSATPGTYNVTISAAGSPGTAFHSTTATFTFAPFDFSITASSPADFNRGAVGKSNITITPIGNFVGTVTLTITVSPSTGLTANCPAALVVTSGVATGTCSPSSSAPGVYMVNVTGTGGGHTHSAIFFSHVGDFSMSTTSPTGIAGSLLNSTITLTSSQNFAGSIALTDTVPAGLSCSVFNPSPVTLAKNATASSRLSCSSTVAGTFTVTIRGAGSPGNASRIATAIFTVTDFTISATSPAPVNAGIFANSTVTIGALNGFAGNVTLTEFVPLGLTCGAVTPSIIVGGSGNATVSCRATVAGNYTLTVTGTTGSLKHNATATFRFQDFAIAASTPVAVNSGISSNSTISITAVNGFSGTTSLTDNVPTGLSCGPITPINVTASGSATVSCSAAVAGNYTLTITGKSAALVHTINVTFQFQDFTITITTPPATANAGTPANATLTIGPLNGFTGTVTLKDTIPSGLTCGPIAPANVTSGSRSATVSCSATVAANYVLTITGTNGGLVHSTTAIFKFVNFTITATSRSGNANSLIISTITVSPVNGFTGAVNLTDTIPAGLSCGAITPSTITGGSGTATVSCSASLAGNYTLTLTGTSGSLTHSTTAIFRVQEFTIIASSPAPVNVGQSASSTVTVTAVNGFNGTVTFGVVASSGLVCGSITPANVTGSGSAIVSCSATLAGNYTATITGTNLSLSHSVIATFSFQDFATSASPTTVTVIAGTAAKSTVTITRLNGFAGVVSLGTNSTSCTMIPSSLTGFGNSTMSCTFTASGIIHVTVTATSTSLSHSTTITVTIQDFTLTASPTSIVVDAGTAATSTITVAPLQGFNSIVNLTTNSTACTVTPNSVTGSGGSTLSCKFASASTVHVTITGTTGSRSHTANVTYAVQDFTISASPTTVSVAVGQSGTSTLTISALNGFTGTIALTSTASPAGLNRALTPASVTLGGTQTSTLTVRATVAGSYLVTVIAKNGPLSHNVTLTILVSDRPLVSVVVGPDGSLYWNSMSPTGSASGWQPLGGSALGAPALCQSGPGGLELVVRGTDNGIYHKSFASGTWSNVWDSPGGATLDQPACAALNSTLYIVVRGLDNITYANSMSLATLTWSGWVSLSGFTPSAPALVATSSSNRLDLLVRGSDNIVYHKAFVNGSWTPGWDSPGGTTSDIPAVVSDGRALDVVVRGTDNGLWYNSYNFTSSSWSTWFSIGGIAASAPSLGLDASGTLHLLVRGPDNGIWHVSRTAGGIWNPSWDSPGGTTSNRLVLTTIGTSVVVLAVGQDNNIYFNVLTGTSWQTWTATGGKSADTPALSSIP